MARPKLLSAQFNDDATAVELTFDQDMTNAVGSGLAPFVHATNPTFDPLQGTTVEDIADEVVTINLGEGPPGLVSVGNGVTLIEQNVLTNNAGEPAYPFVNRRAGPYPISVTRTADDDVVVVRWSEALTLDDAGGIRWKSDAGTQYADVGLTGNGTDTWTVSGSATGSGLQAGRWQILPNEGRDADDAPNTSGAGVMLPEP